MAKRARKKSVKPEAVKKDFHAALDRLIEGKPTCKALKAQAVCGKLKLTKTNLAKEAGRSAALLWRDDYADVKDRLERLKLPKSSPDVAPTVSAIRELRTACEQQIEDAKRLWVDTAELHAELLAQQGQIESFRNEIDRLGADAHKLRAENAKLKAQIHGTNVTEFPG